MVSCEAEKNEARGGLLLHPFSLRRGARSKPLTGPSRRIIESGINTRAIPRLPRTFHPPAGYSPLYDVAA